jgi:hypothetical protein
MGEKTSAGSKQFLAFLQIYYTYTSLDKSWSSPIHLGKFLHYISF